MPTFPILRHEPDTRSFKQGETIFREGDPADCMYAVIEGAVEIHLRGAVVERIAPVGVFGEMALLDRQPRSATAVAAADTAPSQPSMRSVSCGWWRGRRGSPCRSCN